MIVTSDRVGCSLLKLAKSRDVDLQNILSVEGGYGHGLKLPNRFS